MFLPIDTAEVVKVLNLNNDDRIIATFEQHSDRIVLLLERFSDSETWNNIVAESVDFETQKSYKYAYCYLLLSSTIQFLNFKTIGEGIIKTTGFDNQSTELLTGREIEDNKRSLEIEALEMIYEYLGNRGIDRLREIKHGIAKTKQQASRACVI